MISWIGTGLSSASPMPSDGAPRARHGEKLMASPETFTHNATIVRRGPASPPRPSELHQVATLT